MDGASGLGGGLSIVLVAVSWLRVEGLAERNHGLECWGGCWTDESRMRVKTQAVQNHGLEVSGVGCVNMV